MGTSLPYLKAGIKRKRVSCCEKCLICQKGEEYGDLRNASKAGQETFLHCLKRRTNSQDLEVYDKIEHLIDGKDEYSFKDNVSEIKWQKNCYSSFTSEFHIKYATTSEERNSSKETSSLKRQTFNWKERCMFCGQKSYKKDKTMYRVSTFDFCKALESRVKEKEDDLLSCRVGNFSKLMALETRYHSQCH